MISSSKNEKLKNNNMLKNKNGLTEKNKLATIPTHPSNSTGLELFLGKLDNDKIHYPHTNRDTTLCIYIIIYIHRDII